MMGKNYIEKVNLKKILKMKKLNYLDLSNNKLTDSIFEDMEKETKLIYSLSRLDLSDNQIEEVPLDWLDKKYVRKFKFICDYTHQYLPW